MENRETRFAKHWERMFGVRVKDLRAARGWTQGELAKRMTSAGYPMHQTTVAKMESGSRPTNVGEVAALAAIFGVPIGSVFSADDEVDQMLLRMSEATSEAARLAQELVDLTKKELEVQKRLDAATEHVKTLEKIAAQMPGMQRRLAYADYLLDPTRDALDKVQAAIEEERALRGEHPEA